MTTIVAVRKNGKAAIAADSLTTWGTIKESADHVANSSKILVYEDSYLAVTGSSAHKLVLAHWLSSKGVRPRFNTVANIFDAWLSFHRALKDEYFIREYDEDNDPYETSRINLLVANPHGIFSIGVLRTVLEYKTFTAQGSGFEIALGAMGALYNEDTFSAAEIARRAIEVAAEFDDGTALPMELFELDLK